MDLNKMNDAAKVELCRKYFIIGLFGLPLVWLTNAVWFFGEGFLGQVTPSSVKIRKYVILSAMGVLAWFFLLFTWEFVFQDEESVHQPALPVRVNTQRTVFLSRSSFDECFGFALQTYVFKRGLHGLKERITYIDYVRDNSIAAVAGVQEGDVVVAVNDSPVLLESHSALVNLLSSQLQLRLVLLYQDITKILSLSMRSLQLQYILAEKYILLEQLEMEESSLLHGTEGSLSTMVRRARWLSACQDISKSLNLCRRLLNKVPKRDLCRLFPSGSSSNCYGVTSDKGDTQLIGNAKQVTRL